MENYDLEPTTVVDDNGVVHEYSKDWPPLMADGVYWYKQSVPFKGFEKSGFLAYSNWVAIRVKVYIRREYEYVDGCHEDKLEKIWYAWWGNSFGNYEGINPSRIQEMLECGQFIKIEPPGN